jgi:hypothetical protein
MIETGRALTTPSVESDRPKREYCGIICGKQHRITVGGITVGITVAFQAAPVRS